MERDNGPANWAVEAARLYRVQENEDWQRLEYRDYLDWLADDERHLGRARSTSYALLEVAKFWEFLRKSEDGRLPSLDRISSHIRQSALRDLIRQWSRLTDKQKFKAIQFMKQGWLRRHELDLILERHLGEDFPQTIHRSVLIEKDRNIRSRSKAPRPLWGLYRYIASELERTFDLKFLNFVHLGGIEAEHGLRVDGCVLFTSSMGQLAIAGLKYGSTAGHYRDGGFEGSDIPFSFEIRVKTAEGAINRPGSTNSYSRERSNNSGLDSRPEYRQINDTYRYQMDDSVFSRSVPSHLHSHPEEMAAADDGSLESGVYRRIEGAVDLYGTKWSFACEATNHWFSHLKAGTSIFRPKLSEILISKLAGN